MRGKICTAVSVLGFLIVLGTAGTSDVYTLPLNQIVIRGFIGLAMFGGGAYFGGLFE